MNREGLKTFCMLPRWRIRLEEDGDAIEWYLIYWEWCDAQGQSSVGQAVADGNWRLFRDSQGECRVDWSAHVDDKAWEILRNWAKHFGYVDEPVLEAPDRSPKE